MHRLGYIIAILLLAGWLIGAFIFTVGKIIHMLLVLGIIVLLAQRLGKPASK